MKQSKRTMPQNLWLTINDGKQINTIITKFIRAKKLENYKLEKSPYHKRGTIRLEPVEGFGGAKPKKTTLAEIRKQNYQGVDS